MATQKPVMQENDGKPEDEELVIVENKEDLSDGPGDDADGHEDERDVQRDEAQDSDREAIRERRRLEKLERKERREKAINRDKLERDFLLQRNDELERRIAAQEARNRAQDIGAIDHRIQEAVNRAKMADEVIAKAVAAGNGEDVVTAQRYREQALAEANQLAAAKQRQAAAPAPQPQQRMDPAVIDHAKDFLADHAWYNMQGGDEDSEVVLAIDRSLAREGFDPKSDDYWDELRKRVARRLPDRVKSERSARGGPSIGSGREHAPTSTRKEVYISPERKEALIQAGVWDDPVLRQKYVKRYAQYDRDSK